ncbi:MAG: HD domain-containing protein, partial [Oscillospiraceae bacterium]
FLPSVIAAAPIGYFIATFMKMDGGEYMVIMLVLPLLLARYSFSLYIDVKHNFYVMLKTLTNAIEAKDPYTSGHAERVEVYAKIVAEELHFSHIRREELGVAALLHDVGKIGIDENILQKPEYLSQQEREVIKKHPEISVSILKDVKLAPMVFEIILHHHERYDGGGYPSGLGGKDLPMDVYVLSIADTYDAITSDRPYSHGRRPQLAREIIAAESGKQFQPEVVDAFLRAFDKGKLDIGERPRKAEILSA